MLIFDFSHAPAGTEKVKILPSIVKLMLISFAWNVAGIRVKSNTAACESVGTDAVIGYNPLALVRVIVCADVVVAVITPVLMFNVPCAQIVLFVLPLIEISVSFPVPV